MHTSEQGETILVDAHHHVWDLSVRDQPFLRSDPALAPLLRNFTIAELRPLAAAAGVTASVVVQTVNDYAETAELLELVRTGPLVRAVVGWADLTAAELPEDIARLRDLPGGGHLAGIRHPLLTEPDPGWLSRAEVRRGLTALVTADLAFDLVLRPAQLGAAVDACAAIPGLRVVLDHLGSPPTAEVDPAWADDLARLAALPDTFVKLSGVLGGPVDPRALYEVALRCFGPQRMMFGSDWPVSTLDAGYGDIVATAANLIADLSQPEQAAILSGTANAVYRIGL